MSESDLLTDDHLAAIKARADSPTRVTLPHDDIPRLLRHIDVLTECLNRQRDFWHNISAGPDIDAQPDDSSPENADSWLAGIALQDIERVIGGPE